MIHGSSKAKAGLQNEEGVALLIGLVLLFGMAGMGMAGFMITTSEIMISRNDYQSVKAFQLAEAGVERARTMVNTDPAWADSLSDPTNAFAGDNTLGQGSYIVEVLQNTPISGFTTILSTGQINGSNIHAQVRIILKPEFYPIFNFATFNCGNLGLKEGEDNTISGGDVFTSGNLDLEGSELIQDGDVSALGNINIGGTSRILGGNASANGNIDLESSASPNIDGDATAGGNISGGGTVTGTEDDLVSPDPVDDLCASATLPDLTVTAEKIQNFRDNAGTVISGNYALEDGDNVTFSGIVHITGNFESEGDISFSNQVIFVVDGNAEVHGPGSIVSGSPGTHVTFLVPDGDFEVVDGGDVTIDGSLLVGTIGEDGSNRTGGNIDVKDGSNLTINGSMLALNGNSDAASGGQLQINYQPPTDSNLIKPGSFLVTEWQEIRG